MVFFQRQFWAHFGAYRSGLWPRAQLTAIASEFAWLAAMLARPRKQCVKRNDCTELQLYSSPGRPFVWTTLLISHFFTTLNLMAVKFQQLCFARSTTDQCSNCAVLATAAALFELVTLVIVGLNCSVVSGLWRRISWLSLKVGPLCADQVSQRLLMSSQLTITKSRLHQGRAQSLLSFHAASLQQVRCPLLRWSPLTGSCFGRSPRLLSGVGRHGSSLLNLKLPINRPRLDSLAHLLQQWSSIYLEFQLRPHCPAHRVL